MRLVLPSSPSLLHRQGRVTGVSVRVAQLPRSVISDPRWQSRSCGRGIRAPKFSLPRVYRLLPVVERLWATKSTVDAKAKSDTLIIITAHFNVSAPLGTNHDKNLVNDHGSKWPAVSTDMTSSRQVRPAISETPANGTTFFSWLALLIQKVVSLAGNRRHSGDGIPAGS